VLVQELLEVLKTSDLPHLEGMEIIDCYTGPPLPTGKKNITVRLFLRVPERTITDDEADLALKKAIEAIKKAGWSIRE
jgi:phenylalanyl-tRNA synthetase beta chain